ncbi:hypothetical protein [Archaeoglobus sp.]
MSAVMLIKVLALMFIGILLAEILIELNFSVRWNFVKFANLPAVCNTPLIIAFASAISADAMLQTLRENGILRDYEVILSSMLNSTANWVKETITYIIPVVIPILGFKVGLIYVATLWFGVLATLAFVIVAGKFLNRRNRIGFEIHGHGIDANSINKNNTTTKNKDSKRRDFKNAVVRSLKRFGRIATVYVVVTVVSMLIVKNIDFEFLSDIAKIFSIPSYAIPALIAYVASPIVGMSMVSSMLNSGVICERDAIVTVILGSTIALPVFYARSFIPKWVSIFGFKVGVVRGLLDLSIKILTRILVLAIILS